MDVTKSRYASWAELIDYCRYSAAPVGRFVLDVHGESPDTWPANDALCTALQIINHLQDCGKDYKAIDRVYLPLDMLAAAGLDVTVLAAKTAAPALRQCIAALARKTAALLDESAGFATSIVDLRPGARSGGDPAGGGKTERRAHDARSAERECSPRQAAICGHSHPGGTGTARPPHAAPRSHRLAQSRTAMTALPIPSGTGDEGSVAKVRKSSFYTALRILPAAQRDAMYEIYAFCRDVDDIADDGGPHTLRQTQLERWREAIDALYTPAASARPSPLLDAITQFRLKREDFQAVIDGMEMDVTGDIRAPDEETLDLYCDRVASAVGRLSVRVFGMEEADGVALSHHLGRALQLTNILRDIDEDAGIGRLYLPREALSSAGIDTDDPAAAAAHPAIGAACAPVIARAQRHFAEADAIMARSPRRTVRTPRLMYEAYRSILQGLIRRGFDAPRRRIRVGKVRMLLLLLRHGLV